MKDLNIVSVPPFNAFIMIGLEYGYSQKAIAKEAVIKEIQAFQGELYVKEGNLLSASIIEAEIVLKGQIEPHLKIEFTNYPKSIIPIGELKKHIKDLAIQLMNTFEQNRLIISFLDEIVMIEGGVELDPRVCI